MKDCSCRARRARRTAVVTARSHFFRLTAALNGRIPVVPQPRIEGRGVNRGRACAGPNNPKILGAQEQVSRIILAGNKSGRSQVFTVIQG